MVLRTVEEVDVTTGEDSDRRKTAGLRVVVHALDGQHAVADTVVTLVGVPLAHPRAVPKVEYA